VVDKNLLNLSNIVYGGTGFFYDVAPFLPDEIEHHMPDYNLYDDWLRVELEQGGKPLDYQYYTDYSIGYTTRFCFRKCGFCVNKNYNKVEIWSTLKEFVDPDKKYICLLDDNMFGSSQWKEILEGLQNTGKPFQYKQGLDERLLTKEKIEMLFSKSKYKGDYIFAFDNIEDSLLVEEKLKLIRDTYKAKGQTIKLYVFCGFDRNDNYDAEFWKQDIIDIFERIKILMRYNCLPYLMRHLNYEKSPHRGMYINIGRWANQPSFYKKMSLRHYIMVADGKGKEDKMYSSKKYFLDFEEKYPEIAKEYFDMRFEDLNMY
jgi:hypothetical protein